MLKLFASVIFFFFYEWKFAFTFRACYFLILKSCYLGNPGYFIYSVNTYWKAITQSSFWDSLVLFEDAKEGNREYGLFFFKLQNPAFFLSSSFAFAQRPLKPNISSMYYIFSKLVEDNLVSYLSFLKSSISNFSEFQLFILLHCAVRC